MTSKYLIVKTDYNGELLRATPGYSIPSLFWEEILWTEWLLSASFATW